MPNTVYWSPGEWNAVCDQCGRRFKANRIYNEWDNLRVCKQCLDPRHPQEMQRPMTDPKPLPWSRPQAFAYVNPNGYVASRSFNGMPFNYSSVD